MAQWKVERVPTRQPDDECGVCDAKPAPYMLIDHTGAGRMLLCLTCANRPCDPDCISECCQHGGIDRRVAWEDSAPLVPKEVECKKCEGLGVLHSRLGGPPATCWVCQGDGTVTKYVEYDGPPDDPHQSIQDDDPRYRHGGRTEPYGGT